MTMTPDDYLALLARHRATAIIRSDRADVVAPALEAAHDGGFRILEVTLTTPGAFDRIAEFAGKDDIVIGAGTVLSPDDARRAVDAGASFLVSPVLDEEVIAVAHELNVAVMPGCATPTEMFRAHRLGAQLQKLFPGPGIGPKWVKSTLAPLPMLRIVPTNGVHENNALSHLKAGAFAVGFTTALFDPNELANGGFDAIRTKAERLLASIAQTVPAS